MTKIKKPYRQPFLELVPVEPFYLLDGSKKPISGYGIDNNPEDPDNNEIFPITEGPDPDEEEDVDID